jgi:hypothetical protein
MSAVTRQESTLETDGSRHGMLEYPLPPDLGRCVLIPGFLSPSECREMIGAAESRGFSSAELDYPPSYRNNDRQVFNDPDLARRLLERLGNKVLGGMENLLPDDSPGGWRPSAINERFRLCRYGPGQQFHIHQDGVHHRGADCRSMLTFMIYLTDGDDFEGGNTSFYSAGPASGEDASNVIARIRPRIGSLILFDHGIWHAGEEVTAGIKHVLRSDLLFRRDSGQEHVEVAASSHHQGYIWTLAELGDGRVASGGRDGKIRIWHPHGELDAVLTGHSQSVLGLAECGPGMIASVSRDRTLRYWDVATQRCIRSMTAHEAAVLSLVRLPGGKLATCAADHTFRLWSDEGELRQTFTGHAGWVWGMADLGHNRLATASEDGSVRIWDLDTRDCLLTLSFKHPLRSIASRRAGPEDAYALAVGDAKGDLTLWRMDQGRARELRSFKAHDAAIRRIRFLRDGSLATCAEDNRLRIWSYPELALNHEEIHGNFVTDVLELRGGAKVSCGYDGQLRWTLPAPLPAHS